MCHRFQPLLSSELREALEEQRATGRARIPARPADVEVPDAYPGKEVPLFVANASGALEVATLTWGFTTNVGGSFKPVFNTRIETALSHVQRGYGLWAKPITRGRCLVPVRGFYESYTKSPDPHHRPDVRFRLPGFRVFLLAGVQEEGRFSVITTVPNPDVATYHTRMPLVLGPGESRIWLGPHFASLADRSGLRLEAVPQT